VKKLIVEVYNQNNPHISMWCVLLYLRNLGS
jgi:hypothetical protein